MRVVDIDQERKYSMLIYGKSNSGKTGFCASAQEVGNTLLLDVENGRMTVRALSNRFGPSYKPAKIVSVESPRELLEGFSSIRSAVKEGKIEILAIDTLTRMQQYGLMDIIEGRGNRERERLDPDLIDQREWNKILIQFIRLMKNLQQIDIPILCTAQAESILQSDGRGNSVLVGIQPLLRGQFRDSVGGFFDIVGYLENRGDKRLLYIGRHNLAFTRDRSMLLPEVIEEPTYKKVVDILYNGGVRR